MIKNSRHQNQCRIWCCLNWNAVVGFGEESGGGGGGGGGSWRVLGSNGQLRRGSHCRVAGVGIVAVGAFGSRILHVRRMCPRACLPRGYLMSAPSSSRPILANKNI